MKDIVEDTARMAFDEYASSYDCESDEWQDKGVDEHFIAGFKAAVSRLLAVKSLGFGEYFPIEPGIRSNRVD